MSPTPEEANVMESVTALLLEEPLHPVTATPAPIAHASAAVEPVDPDLITRTQIPAHFLSKIAVDELLDLTVGNYILWSRRVYDTLSLCGDLVSYVDPLYTRPDPVARPASAHAWTSNNHHVLSYLRIQCSADEREHLADITLASEIWTFLHDRHQNRGPHVQVLLLRDLLQLRFDNAKPLVPQAHQCITLCWQIITMGPLNIDSLAKVALLHMMRDSQVHIQCAIADALARATVAAPYTVPDIIKCLEMEQTIRADTKTSSGLTTDLAMSAQPQRGNGRVPKQCSNCKRQGHVTADCFQPGGPMEKRRSEVEARVAARKAARAGTAPAAAPVAAPSAPRKFFDATGKAFFLTTVAPAGSSEVTHSAASITEVLDDGPTQLPSDDIPPEWLTDLDTYGDMQYESYLATADVFHVSAAWDSAYAATSATVEPFLFDSSASTHLSPVHADFFELSPIAPHGIRGVNGSVIFATGIGKIRLSLGRGKHLILDHALHVPTASVRLISIRALCDGPHGYLVGFDTTGVTLRNRSGAAFFHGTRVGKGLYSLSGVPPSIDSALAVSCVLTLETWHRRLGHANYCATYTVATQARAAGTPVNLSLLPSKCDHCILGKQTRSPVPKVREGVRSTERGATFFIDTTGDQCTRSASGSICSLDIIDDFSSFGWAFPLRSKGDCSSTLRTFLIARRAEGCPVRRIITDNGECVTKEIKDVCAELGVRFEWTAAETSAHNGKVERVHCTYLGKSRAMCIAAKVPENRWDKLQPTERRAVADGLPWVTALERAVADCKVSSARVAAERIARHNTRIAADIANFTDLDLALAASLQLDSDYEGDPTSLKDALASPFAAEWRTALAEEFASIKDLGVYNLIPRASVPGNRRIMHGKPVFRLKRDEHGNPVRFKARWVCKGYEAVWGQDYYSTTSPTMHLESFRVLIHLAASLDWDLHQVDVKTAFLYGTLPENEICYMEQPRGFEMPGKSDWVWELRKGLYGMPQGGRTWNRTMHDHLVAVGFSRVPSKYCLYHRTTAAGTVITGVHVDDFLAIASSPAAGALFKADLHREWNISDLGEAKFCIGIGIARDRASHTSMISQTALIDRIISQFGLSDAHPVLTPMETDCNLSRVHDSPKTEDEKLAARSWPYRALVGSLNYVAVGSRPDISFAVQQLSQFLDCYGRNHWEAAKRVVRYLKGTRTLALHLGGSRAAFLLGYTDSNHARCADTRHSVGGYCFSLGSGMVSWAARKQPTPSGSTTEAEYIAAAEASKEGVWLRSILLAIGHEQTRPTPLAVDNSAAVTLTGDPTHHSKTKHIDIKHHIIRDYVATEQLHVHWIPTDDNVADIFTKPLAGPKFTLFRGCLGIR
ncbi:Retrovirus-related Pol polyprotein from transposon TNT 1-94 [Trametes pubescens]|uniref:Retrovirus-related Pol polyprotein from transposon TNT 1-94 n=1 Tax=Trametes pubescens TaxID=154538 RepID=A0A1M2VIA3_TRAPU|nr:Retrovirus-related Pol polyprotein from transposon TNT 1-94 [Trametes pubescens]